MRTVCKFQVGDYVLVRDLRPTPPSKWQHGIILSVLGKLFYTVTCEGHQRQVHIDQLIPAGSVAKGPSEVLQKPVIPEVERSTTQVTQLLQDSPPVINLTVSRFDTNNSQKYPYAP